MIRAIDEPKIEHGIKKEMLAKLGVLWSRNNYTPMNKEKTKTTKTLNKQKDENN